MTFVKLTYKELASRVGISPDSARKLVQRRKWDRSTDTDGIARIVVPEEYLKSHEIDVFDTTGETAPDDNSERYIEALKALADSEAKRADAAATDRDRWFQLAMKIVENGGRAVPSEVQ